MFEWCGETNVLFKASAFKYIFDNIRDELLIEKHNYEQFEYRENDTEKRYCAK